MSKEEAINTLIKLDGVDTNLISDGYHTFGDLYEHRIQLFITLCRFLHWSFRRTSNDESPVWKSMNHADGTRLEGWFILGVSHEIGKQISYHLPISKWEQCYFANELVHAPKWDGHTSSDVLERLKKL